MTDIFTIGTKGSAALRLIEDYNDPKINMKSGTRFNVRHSLYKVFEKEQSLVVDSSTAYSYIWWKITMDDYGCPTIKTDASFKKDSLYEEYIDNYGIECIFLPELESKAVYELDDIMLQNGLQFGRNYLSRIALSFDISHDYYHGTDGEYNLETEIIYSSERDYRGKDVPVYIPMWVENMNLPSFTGLKVI